MDLVNGMYENYKCNHDLCDKAGINVELMMSDALLIYSSKNS